MRQHHRETVGATTCRAAKTATQSIPALHGGCRLHQRTQPAQWHESASRYGRKTPRSVSNARAHLPLQPKQLRVAFKTCGECHAEALKYLLHISVHRRLRVMRLLSPIGTYLPLHGRQNLQMRGLGSTCAERGVVRRTGQVMEAEPAEFVLTAEIPTRHVHAHPHARRMNAKYRGHGRVVSASTCSVLLSLQDLATTDLSTNSKSQLVRR